MGKGDPEKVLAGLLQNGVVYESSAGKYKAA
jgi:hypothetical protein